ncbi:hypothetical protein EBU02_08600, partial [bacterium]|nr:hypothetical protein [bacterium]
MHAMTLAMDAKKRLSQSEFREKISGFLEKNSDEGQLSIYVQCRRHQTYKSMKTLFPENLA